MLPFLASTPISFISLSQANTSALGAGLNINKPTSVVEGNLLVFVVATNANDITGNSSVDVTGSFTPVGSVQIWDSGSGTDQDKEVLVFSKIAGPSEPSTYTITVSAGGSVLECAATMLNFSPVTNEALMHDTGGSYSGTYGTSPRSITATDSGTFQTLENGIDLSVSRIGISNFGTSSVWTLSESLSGFSVLAEDHFSTNTRMSYRISWKVASPGTIPSNTYTATDAGAGTESASVVGCIFRIGNNNV